ncbi:MAG TPA: hypothetical protein DEA22_14585 [Blastocatellia bacterium]|nr:hypothetical protein [Blastocatellia bacterium]
MPDPHPHRICNNFVWPQAQSQLSCTTPSIRNRPCRPALSTLTGSESCRRAPNPQSESASAAEVFARVIQLEKRGKIIGDLSSGAVMTSIQLGMANVRGTTGFETVSLYSLNLTIGDLVMSDGNRLENIGVVPDLPIGPSQYALANKNDPILAYAAGLMGAKITERAAGELHFLMPKTEDDDDEKASQDGDTPDDN